MPTDIGRAADAEIAFIAVGTPQLPGAMGADLSQVDAAVAALLEISQAGSWERPALLVGKSTVPVGTAARIADHVEKSGKPICVVWNPEFLREGFAVQDTLHPDRIVYGLPDGPAGLAAKAVLDECYAPLLAEGIPRLIMDYATAELVKVAANSFLATKISFINSVAEVCEAAGADVTVLAEAIGLDNRIGTRFLQAGIGFGGGCLPKDLRAFVSRAEALGVDLPMLRSADERNLAARERASRVIGQMVGGDIAGKRVAVLGAAFKPDSDDLRDSPAVALAEILSRQGAHVAITDPAATPAMRHRQTSLEVCDTWQETVSGADIVVIGTQWREYCGLLPEDLEGLVRGKSVFDGRNVLDPVAWRQAGWQYRGVGR